MIKNFFSSVSGKLMLSGFLVLVLLIPLFMVGDLIGERENRSVNVQQEIASKWGKRQNIAGPFLVKNITVKRRDPGNNRIFYTEEQKLILPEKLSITADIRSFEKKRSIYTAVLYETDFVIEGYFSRKQLVAAFGSSNPTKVFLSLKLSDTRGFIADEQKVKFNNSTLEFLPGSKIMRFASGVHAFVNLSDKKTGDKIHFKITARISGSQALYFNPTAKQTTAKISSNWQHPKFDGMYLPNKRDINSKGFTAEYQISWLGRSYGQVITNNDELNNVMAETPAEATYQASRYDKYNDSHIQSGSNAFGVELIRMANQYQKTERSVKYGILFLALTFGAFFLSEILFGLKLHPIQYLMIGSMLVLFFLLLISFSEHLSFIWAYIIATVASSGVIAVYSLSILKQGVKSLVPAGLLLGLYAFLYILLQSEDFALLVGSLLLFAVVAAAMYLTRKIDWYAIDFDKEK